MTTPAPAVSAPAVTDNSARETLQYQLGLDPVRTGGRVTGYALKPGARVPHLGRAGVQPGDVIVGVNGSQLDAERLMELSWQINNSESTEIEFIRNGKRMKGTIRPGT
jgi:type II secretory pathway component PulC